MNNYSAASQEEMMNSFLQNLDNSDDPYKKMLGQMMLQNWHNSKTSSSANGNSNFNKQSQQGTIQQDVRTLIAMNRELMQEYRALKRDWEQLHETNAYASAALGACECWGQDAVCPTCGGKGIPGSFQIDEVKFGQLIQPLFEQLLRALQTNTAESQ